MVETISRAMDFRRVEINGIVEIKTEQEVIESPSNTCREIDVQVDVTITIFIVRSKTTTKKYSLSNLSNLTSYMYSSMSFGVSHDKISQFSLHKQLSKHFYHYTLLMIYNSTASVF